MNTPSSHESGDQIKLVVADDHVVIREALCQMLVSRGSYHILGQVSDGAELLEMLNHEKPDLVILDLTMPNVDGLTTLQRLREGGNLAPVLVLSADDQTKNIRQVIKLGAQGFMPKNAKLEELEFAIESILSGNTYLSPSVTAALMASSGSESVSDSPLGVLTKREIEIMKFLANGKPNREIGKLLHISSRTVDTHRSNILKKLGVRGNAELTKLAIAHHLIEV